MIQREEQIGDCRLILGDSMEVLPGIGPIDAVVTDPPYGIGSKMVGSGHFAGMCIKMGDWDKAAPPPEIFLRDCPAIVWGGNYIGLPPSRGWLVWRKTNAAPSFADAELAWTNMDMNIKTWLGPVGPGISDRVNHPTQKPLPLMVWCLGFLPNARTILDPFMGSGTTLVACAKLGRAGIGIERDPDYFDIACRRVEAAYGARTRFVSETEAQGVLL